MMNSIERKEFVDDLCEYFRAALADHIVGMSVSELRSMASQALDQACGLDAKRKTQAAIVKPTQSASDAAEDLGIDLSATELKPAKEDLSSDITQHSPEKEAEAAAIPAHLDCDGPPEITNPAKRFHVKPRAGKVKK